MREGAVVVVKRTVLLHEDDDVLDVLQRTRSRRGLGGRRLNEVSRPRAERDSCDTGSDAGLEEPTPADCGMWQPGRRVLLSGRRGRFARQLDLP
jgi:hypothetical protein